MPPHSVPEEYYMQFTMEGRIPVERMYVDDSNVGKGTHYKADRAQVEVLVDQFRRIRAGLAQHKLTWLFEALKAYPVIGQRVAVIGSAEPSTEAALLAHEAVHVTTIEYNNLTYSHPNLTQVRQCELQGLYGTFDTIVTLSSLDHDGLGRYGDLVDPDADLKAMKVVRNLLKHDIGVLLMTVPIGPDVVVWNLHRRYGQLRLPLFLRGWTLLQRFGWEDSRLNEPASWRRSYEPVHVLKPALDDAEGPWGAEAQLMLEREL